MVPIFAALGYVLRVRLLLPLDIPSNMNQMPVPNLTDVIAAAWAVMNPLLPYMAIIIGMGLAFAAARAIFGLGG